MIKKAKNTAILNDNKNVEQKIEIRVQKPVQVLEIPDSDYINFMYDRSAVADLKDRYNLKSITIQKGRNTVIEIYK